MTNVTCGLTAKKPGSPPCSTLVIEYGTTLLYFTLYTSTVCILKYKHCRSQIESYYIIMSVDLYTRTSVLRLWNSDCFDSKLYCRTLQGHNPISSCNVTLKTSGGLNRPLYPRISRGFSSRGNLSSSFPLLMHVARNLWACAICKMRYAVWLELGLGLR